MVFKRFYLSLFIQDIVSKNKETDYLGGIPKIFGTRMSVRLSGFAEKKEYYVLPL